MNIGSVGIYQQNKQQNFGMISVPKKVGVSKLVEGVTVKMGIYHDGSEIKVVTTPFASDQENRILGQILRHAQELNKNRIARGQNPINLSILNPVYDTIGERYIYSHV